MHDSLFTGGNWRRSPKTGDAGEESLMAYAPGGATGLSFTQKRTIFDLCWVSSRCRLFGNLADRIAKHGAFGNTLS